MVSKDGRRLLVVDDDGEITSSFKTILSCEGYDVRTAGDGPEALDLVRREAFDLVLLDLLLPGMDGWTVLQRINALAPTTRVVILCADVDTEGEMEARRLGAVDVLLKPPDIQKLLCLVDELTRKAEEQSPTMRQADLRRRRRSA